MDDKKWHALDPDDQKKYRSREEKEKDRRHVSIVVGILILPIIVVVFIAAYHPDILDSLREAQNTTITSKDGVAYKNEEIDGITYEVPMDWEREIFDKDNINGDQSTWHYRYTPEELEGWISVYVFSFFDDTLGRSDQEELLENDISGFEEDDDYSDLKGGITTDDGNVAADYSVNLTTDDKMSKMNIHFEFSSTHYILTLLKADEDDYATMKEVYDRMNESIEMK